MAADASKVELRDNDQASRRLKRDFIIFEREHCVSIKRAILSARKEISNK